MAFILAVDFSALTIPAAIIAVALAGVFVLAALASRYKRIPPNAIGVFYGRKYKYRDPADGQTKVRGFAIITGGGRILWPVVERYEEMSTAAFLVEVDEQNIPSAQNVSVSVKGVATLRVSQIPEFQSNAVAAFLGKSQLEMQEFIGQILKGHTRSIIGKLSIEELLRDRAALNVKVVEESSEECKRLGLEIVTFVIQDVRDQHGYIDALGKRAIAETMRDAQIRVAEAEKETKIKVSNAQQEAASVEADNAAKIADSQKQRDIKIAQFKTETETKRAGAEAAYAIANADQQKRVMVLEAERDQAATQARIAVQEQEGLRKKKELEATRIVEAQANKEASIIAADGAQQVAKLMADKIRIEAEAGRNAAVLAGEGEASKSKAINVALAEGEAAKVRQVSLAQAEGQERLLLAQAAGKKESLLAEAIGTERLAEALQKLNDQGRFIVILDKLPLLIANSGDAFAKVCHEVFPAVAKPFERIDKITITDLGGSGGGKALETLGGIVPKIVAEAFAIAQAKGMDITGLLKAIKIDPAELSRMIAGSDTKASHPDAPKPVPPTPPTPPKPA
jgi:flotillin